MKKQQKKAPKKLNLNKETVTKLQQVAGGLYYADQQVSDGPAQCWFSECASC